MVNNRGLQALLLAAIVATNFLWVGSATAREDEIEPTAPAPAVAAGGKANLALGVAGTSDYVSRGVTQSDSNPAIQGYVEPSYGLGPSWGDIYANIWSSNVDFGDDFEGAEIDVAGGTQTEIPRTEVVTEHRLRSLFLRAGPY